MSLAHDEHCLPGDDTLHEAERVSLHASIRIMKDRLHALELGHDAGFLAHINDLDALIRAGEVEDDGLSADEFAEQYLPAS